MYASSFVLGINRLLAVLKEVLSLETFRHSQAAQSANTACRIIDDLSELSTVAISNISFRGRQETDADSAVRTLLTARFEAGFDAELPANAVDRGRAADRITEIDGTILIPVGELNPDMRNWWVLAGLLCEHLSTLITEFQRVCRRAEIDAPDWIETAFWTVTERLVVLRDSLSETIAIGQYVDHSARNGTPDLLTGLRELTSEVTGGDHA